jgi:hypothetical protein
LHCRTKENIEDKKERAGGCNETSGRLPWGGTALRIPGMDDGMNLWKLWNGKCNQLSRGREPWLSPSSWNCSFLSTSHTLSLQRLSTLWFMLWGSAWIPAAWTPHCLGMAVQWKHKRTYPPTNPTPTLCLPCF